MKNLIKAALLGVLIGLVVSAILVALLNFANL